MGPAVITDGPLGGYPPPLPTPPPLSCPGAPQVDKEVNGSRLLKPGSDAHFAVVLDITWESAESAKPSLSWEFVKVKDFAADPDLQKKMEEAYAPLMDLRNTELTPVPERFRPLSSKNSRGQVTTMGQFVCSLVRDAFTSDPQSVDVDVCLIRGGHICGEKDFPPDAFFSFEDLKTVNTDKVAVGVLEIPGSVVVEAVRSTRGSINRLFVQYDDSCAEAEVRCPRLKCRPPKRSATCPAIISAPKMSRPPNCHPLKYHPLKCPPPPSPGMHWKGRGLTGGLRGR